MKLINPAPLTFEYLDDTHFQRPSVHLRGAQGEKIVLSVVNSALIRVQLLPDGDTYRNPRTWAILTDGDDMPREGLPRDLVQPYPCDLDDPDDMAVIEVGEAHLIITTKALQLHVDLEQFALRWFTLAGELIAADLERGAYLYDANGRALYHYLKRDLKEHYYGFGEVSGALDKAGMRIRLNPVDALGYNAETSDPLYKHFPFYMTFHGETQQAYGLFYDNTSPATFDMGKEIDYTKRARFRYYRAEDGDLDYYFLYGGQNFAAVSRAFSRLIGTPVLPPKWTLGYLGSTMSYTEAADAQAQLSQFAQLCQQHDIPCDLFHLSSGYTTDADGRRMVFTWNKMRVPDPQGMVANFHNAGIRLAANVKPHLLTTHPLYTEAARQGTFITQADSAAPATSQYWSGGAGTTEDGSLTDFTSAAGFDWWKAHIKSALLEYGIDAIWNDNNEFEIDDTTAICDGFGQPITIAQVRPLQTYLMAQASYQAMREHAPSKRPYLITRSASVGAQRYAQTWSGDNETSWHSLKWNTPMGLGMSLSGMPNIGHDVGGFYGEKPDAELFLRWVQCGIFYPRFCIHSWNTDGTVNEAWMYPEILPHIREALRFRYRLIPYLYNLLVRSHVDGSPIIAPLVYHFPHDTQTHRESFDFMLGAHLLIAPVYEPQATIRRVYLPRGSAWCDFYTGEWHEGGQTLEVALQADRIPVFARDGALIPMGKAMRYMGEQPDDLRQLYAFIKAQPAQITLYEDDGITFEGAQTQLTCAVALNGEVKLSHTGEYPLPYQAIEIILPPNDTKTLNGGEAFTLTDAWGATRGGVRVTL